MLPRKLYYYLRVRNNPGKEPSALRARQFQMLKNVVEHAYRKVPLYRELYDEKGFRPEMLESFEDVEKIPLVPRERIKEGFPEEVLAEDIPLNDYYSRSTSGSSSGNPMTVVWDEQSWDYAEAVYLRSLREAGYQPWKPLAYYWWEEFDDEFYNRFFMRKELVHKDLEVEEQWERLKELDPEYIYYFATSIYILAKYADRMGEEDAISPRSIITHAEILTPGMRRKIEDVFDCPVYDHYGSTEFNRMAGECKRGNYHMDIDAAFFEFPGWEGYHEVVATNLVNYKMPLIRYPMKDVVEIGEGCGCGNSFPSVQDILGRKQDFFDIDGGKVPPTAMIDALSGNNDILEFRIAQETETEFHVQYQLNAGAGDRGQVEEDIKRSLEEVLSRISDDDFDVSCSEEMPGKTRNGKLPLVG